MSPADPVTLRHACDGDAPAIARLAGGRPAPRAPLLVALVGAQLRAALSLDGGELLQDPAAPSAAAAELLRARAEQLGARRRPWRRRLVAPCR